MIPKAKEKKTPPRQNKSRNLFEQSIKPTKKGYG